MSFKSWAYHGDNDRFYCYVDLHAAHLGETYGPSDTMGCEVDFDAAKIWFTKSEEMLSS